MKKILAALDGLKYSDSTTSYAVQLAKLTDSHLVGIFLDDFTYHSYRIYDVVGNAGVSEEKLESFEEKDRRSRKEATTAFEAACKFAGLNYSIHHDKNIAIQDLLHESIYADMLVIDTGETLTHYEEKAPTRFIRDLLANIQCPVLAVPHKYREIDKLVLLYNGEPSSVHAIKMFSYMLPVFKQLETEVLSVNPEYQGLHLPDNKLMKEFMKRHFPHAKFTVMHGDPETEISHRLKQETFNTLVVLGAYKRNMVSRWFKPSMADALMKNLKSPLFIAHG